MCKLSIDSCFLVQHAFFLGRMAYPARHTYVDAEIVLSLICDLSLRAAGASAAFA